MIKNYLRVTFRTFRKNKSYIAINGLGLGISLACCITAYMLMAFNLEFDDFYNDEKVARIFRIHTLSTDKDGKVNRDVQAPMVLAPMAVDDISGVERFTRYIFGTGTLQKETEAFHESIAFADSSFFDLFELPLLSGSHAHFRKKNSIFLSEVLAKKYFGDENPTGRTMVLSASGSEIALEVGGVINKLPLNNTFRFPALVRIENFLDIHHIKVGDWSNENNPSTFLELASPENVATINSQLSKYVSIRNQERDDHKVDAYVLETFKSSFNENDIRQSWVNHRMHPAAIYIFAAMVLAILLIACFNLTNTSIALTSRRMKEVGVRKAIGAARRQIVSQFLFETLVTIMLSLAIGLLMAQLIVPAFTSMWDMQYGLEDMNGLNLFVALVLLVFFAALIAGIYPALLSSGFRPTLLLKGSAKIQGTNMLTRVMICAQFALSVIVLIGGVVFIQNASFQENLKYGYDKKMIITVSIGGENEFTAMENTIAAHPKILGIAAANGNVGGNNYEATAAIDTSKYRVQVMVVGKNYFETMGLTFAHGRGLNPDNASDQIEGVVVNTAFLEKTGLVDPLDKIVTLHDQRRRIVGVVQNHIDNLWRSDNPESFVFIPGEKSRYASMLVRAEHADLAEVQEYLQASWKKLFPNKPFESQYLEDVILQESRKINTNLKKTFLFITVLGVILSASGIFALASLNIAKRMKEIGVRKALGASVANVIVLLNKEFLIILIVASTLGAVAGFYFSGTVLSVIYAHHIDVGIAPVVGCAWLILGIGLATTSTTIFKAATANPIHALRND